MSNADLQVGNLDDWNDDFVELVVCYLEGELSDSQRDRLKAFLAEDVDNRDAFVTLCFQASLLTACVNIGAASDNFSPAEESALSRAASSPAPGFLGDTWNGMVGYFSHGGPLVYLTYLAAILVCGLGLLAASLLPVTRRAELAERSGPPPAMTPVGTITRMSDCQWADPRTRATFGSVVALGAKFELTAGLLEITYNSGETVAIRGPAAYEVDSPNSGFLTHGRLAARSDQTPDIGNRQPPAAQSGPQPEMGLNFDLPSQNPQAPPSSPSFTIRTSTTVVTDRGAMFGVEIDASGANQAHVLRGNVELRFANGAGTCSQVIPLREYESARIEELGAIRSASVIRYPTRPRSSATPVSAVVIASPSQGPPLAQRISATAVPNKGAPGCLWTCADTFPLSLKGMIPGTATLKVSFIAHNYVKRIRFNGKILPVPQQTDRNTTNQFAEFSLGEGLVQGENRLEIDVAETNPSPTGSSPLTLKVQVGGYVLCEGTGSADVAPHGDGKQEKK